jgi:hypothetical protein
MPFAALAVPLIGTLFSAGVSYVTNRLFGPKRQDVGKLGDDAKFFNGNGFGQPITEIYGGTPGARAADDGTGFQVEGEQIWGRPIREIKQRRGGGKRQPKTTQFLYSATFAAAFARGVVDVRQVYLNENLVFDRYGAKPGASFTIDAGGVISGFLEFGNCNFRIYPGTETQSVDPTIQALEGVGNAPAYLGLAYIVFDGLALEKLGNSLPRVIVHCESADAFTVDSIAGSLAGRVGLLESEWDFAAAEGFVSRGLVRAQRAPVRESLDTLATYHRFYFRDDGERVVAAQFDEEPVATIAAEDLGARDGDDPIEPLEIERPDELLLPEELEVGYVDGKRNRETNQARARAYDTDARAQASIGLPLNLTAEQAQQFADSELFRRYLEADRFRFSVSQAYGWLRVGDVVEVEDGPFLHRVRIDKISGSFPGLFRVEGVRASAATYTQPPFQSPGESPGESTTPPAVYEASETRVEFANLPNLDADGANPIYSWVAPVDSTKDWPGALVEIDRGAGFEDAYLTGSGALIGDVVGELPAATGIDLANALVVELPPGESLSNATADQIAAGGNNALVGEEIIGFRTAAPVSGGENRWSLGGLHRGLFRTENAAGAHADGERFILLDSATTNTIAPRAADRDVARDFRATTSGRTTEEATDAIHTWRAGATNFAASPVGLSGGRAEWTAGSPATAQKLLYRRVGAAIFAELTLTASATSATLTGLSSGRTYEARLEQVISRQVYVSPLAQFTVPVDQNAEAYVDGFGDPYVDGFGENYF